MRRVAFSDWPTRSLSEVADALQSGSVSSVVITEACIAQIQATRQLNMFVADTFEQARECAIKSDQRRANGTSLGPLDGIPIAVKDIFCMQNNVPTTAGSKILKSTCMALQIKNESRKIQTRTIYLYKCMRRLFRCEYIHEFRRHCVCD